MIEAMRTRFAMSVPVLEPPHAAGALWAFTNVITINLACQEARREKRADPPVAKADVEPALSAISLTAYSDHIILALARS
jgi:hypothetical protein